MSRKPRRDNLTANALAAPVDADRKWFADNPDQDSYTRPITDAEAAMLRAAGESQQTHTIVTQLAPGVRQRRFVTLIYQDCN